MFLADCHTHSLCSPDSNAPMLQMAQKAYEYGLHTLCLTDHCDLLSLEGERTLDYDWTPVHRERKGMLDAFGARLDLPMGLSLAWAICFPRHLRKFSGSRAGFCHRLLPQPGRGGGRTGLLSAAL